MDNVMVLLKAVILKDGQLLALKRSSTVKIRPGLWDIPGGELEFGEDAEGCILREIKEETGLKVKNLKAHHAITEFEKDKNTFWVEIGYTCDYESGDVRLSQEHTDFRWLPKEKFLVLRSAYFLREFARKS